MKKIFPALIVALLMLCLVGCGNNAQTDSIELYTEENEETSEITIEAYVNTLPDEAKSNFALFWQSVTSACGNIEYKLRHKGSTITCKFDPFDSENIPAEISEIADFDEWKLFPRYDNYGNYEMIVEGAEITLYIGGFQYYPTNESYMTVVELVG